MKQFFRSTLQKMSPRGRTARGLLLLALALLSCGRLSAWTDRDYSWHDYVSFADLPEANRRIDMADIDYPLLNAAVFYETNDLRVQYGLPPFRHSLRLENAAAGHSADMAKRGYLSHESPLEDKKTLRDRIAGAGLDFKGGTIGENIADEFGIEYEGGQPAYPPAAGQKGIRRTARGEPIPNHTYRGLAKAVVAGWMKSPPHRRNILNHGFTFLGAGCAHFTLADFYDVDCFKVTQDFSSDIRGREITGAGRE